MVKVYRVWTVSGEQREIQAISPSDALKSLGTTQATKISLDLLRTYQLNYGADRVTMTKKEALQFAQQMTIFLGVVLDFPKAVEMSLSRIGNRAALARRMKIVRKKIAQGDKLVEILAALGFPREYLPTFRVGEDQGALTEAFRRVSVTLDEQQELQGTILRALITPTITLAILTVGFFVMVLFVFPKMIDLFHSALRSSPSPILQFDMFLVQNKGSVALGALATLISAIFWLTSKGGRMFLLNVVFMVPLLKDIILIYRAEKFLLAFEMPILAGSPFKLALKQVMDSSSGSEKRVYRKVYKLVEEGKTLGVALAATKYFPEDFTSWVASIEEGGVLSDQISTLRMTYSKLLAQRFETSKQFIAPLLLFVAGGAVIIMAIALYAPILDLISTLMNQGQ